MKFLSYLAGAFALAFSTCAVPAAAQVATAPRIATPTGGTIPAQGALLVDQTGAEKGTVANPLVTTGGAGSGSSSVAQGSTTAGQTGPLDQCATVSGDQSYVVGTTNPVTCTTTGRVKVGTSYSTNVTPAALPTTTLNAALVGCQYRASPLTWSDTWTGSIRCDSSGRIATVLEQPLPTGTNTIGFVNLAALGGAATATKQDTGNTALGNIDAKTYTDALAVTVTGRTSVGDLTAAIDTIGYRTFVFQITGTWSGTIGVTQSNDGITWSPNQSCVDVNSGSWASTSTYVSGKVQACPVQSRYVKLVAPTYGSGTINAAAVLRLTNLDTSSNSVVLGSGGSVVGYVYQSFALTPGTTGGIASTTTTVASSGLVLKAAAGILYNLSVTTGGTAGFVLVTNTTTVPADGAITPVRCYPIAANTGAEWTYNSPIYLATGVSVSFSTTGCFNKTASATAFISGDVR